MSENILLSLFPLFSLPWSLAVNEFVVNEWLTNVAYSVDILSCCWVSTVPCCASISWAREIWSRFWRRPTRCTWMTWVWSELPRWSTLTTTHTVVWATWRLWSLFYYPCVESSWIPMDSLCHTKEWLRSALNVTLFPSLTLRLFISFSFLFLFWHILPSLSLPLLLIFLSSSALSRAQTGTLRVNCLDCLDRSNSAQKLFGLWVSVSFPYVLLLAFVCSLFLTCVILDTLPSLLSPVFVYGEGGGGRIGSVCLPLCVKKFFNEVLCPAPLCLR